jgi:hypothetical protein
MFHLLFQILVLSVYVAEWTVGAGIFMDSSHAVSEKLYFEVLALLIWFYRFINVWEDKYRNYILT